MKKEYLLSAVCVALVFASTQIKSPWLGLALALAGIALIGEVIKEVKAWRTTT